MTLQRDAQSLWGLARVCSEQMRRKLEGGSQSRSAMMMEAFYRIFRPGSPFMKQRDFGPPFDVDLNFSNIGMWPYEKTRFGRLGELGDVFTGQSTSPGRAAQAIHLYMCRPISSQEIHLYMCTPIYMSSGAKLPSAPLK